MWVTESRTQVDTDEIVVACGQAKAAVESLGLAAFELWEVGSTATVGNWVAQWNAVLAGPSGAAVSAVTAQAQFLLEEARTAVRLLVDRVQDHADWLAQAALIYAAAEGGALAYTHACGVLEEIGCSFPASSGPGFQWRTGLGLATVLPASLGEFQSGGGSEGEHAPRGALTMQAALGDLAGTDRAVAGTAASVARWWNDIGEFFSGKALGVVVVGPDGRGAWGSRATVSLGVPVPLSPGKEVASVPVAAALERIRDADYSRTSSAQLLAEVGLDPTGAPMIAAGASNASEPTLTRLVSSVERGAAAVATPVFPAALLARIATSGSSPSSGEVQILRHSHVSYEGGAASTTSGVSATATRSERRELLPSGSETGPRTTLIGAGAGGSVATGSVTHSWSVVVRGTQTWLPGSSNPQDMQSNLEVVGRKPSDQKAAVRLAMDLAGIQPGDPVEFVGHSQGGAIALDLAEELEESGRYNVVSVLTAGSPTGGLATGLRAPVLNLENLSDFVTALDGSTPASANSTNVLFDARTLPGRDEGNAHSLRTYVAAAARAQAEADLNPMAARVGAWGEARANALGLDAQTRTEALYYRSTRVRGVEGRL